MTNSGELAKIDQFTKQTRGCGEMVDALALGASGATHGGSSPLIRTKVKTGP